MKSKSAGASESKSESRMEPGKHGGGRATKESAKSKKIDDADSEAAVALADQVAESEAKSSKSKGRIPKGFTTDNSATQRSQMINRHSTIALEAFFRNRSISEVLARSDKNLVQAVVAQVRYITFFHFDFYSTRYCNLS